MTKDLILPVQYLAVDAILEFLFSPKATPDAMNLLDQMFEESNFATDGLFKGREIFLLNYYTFFP